MTNSTGAAHKTAPAALEESTNSGAIVSSPDLLPPTVTPAVARSLAPHVPPDSLLHMSGYAKGCAHARPAPLTVTATRDGFDLIRQGRAGDAPEATSLTPEDIIKAI